MKSTLLILFLFFCGLNASAIHGKGGLITYEYLGSGAAPNSSKYRITVKQYFDCHGVQFILAPIIVGVYKATANTLETTLSIPKSKQYRIEKTNFGCINPAPEVCYEIVDFVTDVELPNIAGGYILSEQACCRISALVNIQNSSSFGQTNTIAIGYNNSPHFNNSSPVFVEKDTSVICFDAPFTLDFSATDKDGDSLVYAFCSAKATGSQVRQPNPPSAPPYPDLVYAPGFSSAQPLGNRVSINSKTGIISGIAPSAFGSYIITVCVQEYRAGKLIGETKKEVQVEVGNCKTSVAILNPSYINCDGYSFTFRNEMPSQNIAAYNWDFGVPNSNTDVSTDAQPLFNYPDTGKYVVTLKVTSTTGCEDSMTSVVSVYPGFDVGFVVTDSCPLNPFIFKDTTRAAYGAVTTWKWDLGEANAVSSLQNPSHQYITPGNYIVSLIATSSKGCRDTISKTITVYPSPALSLSFRDTLICSIDTLPLQAIGSGSFSWLPNTNIMGSNTASPLVFPKDTTVYTVTLSQYGCVLQDSVKVNVLDFISVALPPDTTICLTDAIVLRPQSDALHYLWSPATGLDDPLLKNPTATPSSDIIYQLIANVGKCQDTTTISIKAVPYPKVSLNENATICYGDGAQLSAVISASSFTWSPVTSLSNTTILNPVAAPLQTTTYRMQVSDTLGCPKVVSDSITITVLPKINAFAGNDTVVVANQPLQLNASGGTVYSWSPIAGLNNPAIANPVAILDASYEKVTYVVQVGRADGCMQLDSMTVTVFKTDADILVPTGFTPNRDGKNDVLKPIVLGMKTLESFKVFNRWGQLVFSTNQTGKGWDGTINGKPQKSDVFVYIAAGITYRGDRIVRKGTTALIR